MKIINKNKKKLPAVKQTKAGYKNTKLGWIPEDWELKNFTDVADIDKNSLSSNTNADFEFDYISLSDVNNKSFLITTTKETFATAPSRARRIVKKGNVLMSTVRPNLQGFTFIQNNVDNLIASTGFAVISTIKCNNEYLYHYLFCSLISKQFHQLLVGSNYPAINSSDVKNLKIPLPPLPEQKAIANLLSNWDEAITKTKALIEQKELRKKWLMQKLLTGKKRFSEYVINDKNIKTKVGALPKDWEIMYISDLLIRVKKPFIPELNKLYQQIGIRSHTKGIFYKKSITGKSLGNKSVFWIQPDCFIVNIVFAWEHAIAKTTEKEKGMIASHRFPMYKPKKEILDLDYLLYFFKTKRGKHLLGLASPGGAGRNKTLGQTEFMKLQIPVPDIKEQRKIAIVLQTSDKEIGTLKAKLDKLKEQKKGLMQILLTGKKRLNLNLQN